MFVRGAYRSGQTDDFVDALPTAAAAGFNMVRDRIFDGFDYQGKGVQAYINEAREYLDGAHANGLGVFLALPQGAVNAYDEPGIARMVAELSDHPALLMWYLHDQPHPSNQPVWNHANTYRLIKRLNPQRPVVASPAFVGSMLTYWPFSDIMWSLRFPFSATERDSISIAPLAAHYQAHRQFLKETKRGSKPVWSVMQLHDERSIPDIQNAYGFEQPDAETYRPDEAELRAQAHVALANGAPALVYFWGPESWINMETEGAELWAWLSQILKELGELENVLLHGGAAPAVRFRGEGDKFVAWTRRLGDDIYAGIANSSVYQPQQATLETDFEFGAWEQIQGDGVVIEENGTLQLSAQGAGVAVLRFSVGAFDKWREQNFTREQMGDLALSGSQANLTGDGLPNLLVFAFNGNPFKADPSILPQVSPNPSDYLFRYRKSHEASDFGFNILYSENLFDWELAMGRISETVEESGSGHNLIRVELSPETDPPERAFFRIEIDPPN